MSAVPAPSSPRHPVVLVGAGPGDPELLTLKAVKAIAAADVVLVDDLVDRRVLDHARPDARIVEVGKRGGCASTSQAFIERLLVHEAQAGRRVGATEGRRSVRVRPRRRGSASAACGWRRGRGGTRHHRRQWPPPLRSASRLPTGAMRRASCSSPAIRRTPPASRIGQQLARCGLTLVVYMGVAHCERISHALIAGGLAASTPAAAVQAAYTDRQRSHVTTLGRLAERVAPARHRLAGDPRHR